MRLCVGLLLSTLFGMVFAYGFDEPCLDLKDECFPVREAYEHWQPLHWRLLLNTPENRLIDNVCQTIYRQPDTARETFEIIYSYVYRNGSNKVESFIIIDAGRGTDRQANPDLTVTYQVFGFPGCDTFIVYGCRNYGDGEPIRIAVLGPHCRHLTPSCLRRAAEIVREAGLPYDDFYSLPMNLPPQCVTKRSCIAPPNPYCN